MLLVYERLLIQALVPDVLSGRVFGIRDAITAWAFAAGSWPVHYCSTWWAPGDDYRSRACGLLVWLANDDRPAAVRAVHPTHRWR